MENIKRFRRAASRLSTLVFAAVPALCTAETVLEKVPPLTVEQVSAYPQNLARYHMGARVEAAPRGLPISNLLLSTNSGDENAAEAALLCDDPTVGYALPLGKTTLLVSLSKIQNVGSISFLNTAARGEVSVAISNAKLPEDSPQWHIAIQQQLSSAPVQARVGPSEAKYIRLTFNVTEAGRIYGLGVYSNAQVSEFTAPRSRKLPVQDQSDSFALISYNLTDLHARARALYVSSGDDPKQANNMIDGQATSSYSFAAEDGSPTALVDLGKASTLRRLAAVYSPQSGSIRFYVLQSLPRSIASDKTQPSLEVSAENSAATQTASGTLKLDDAAWADLKPVGSVTDDGNRGRASIDFPAITGRYVMVRWTPAAQQNGFSLAEVSAFGGAGERNTILAANTRVDEGEGQVSDGKTMLDGKTMIDAKDVPAEGPAEAPQSPAEGPPPTLPQPPPFTFVPILIPASP